MRECSQIEYLQALSDAGGVTALHVLSEYTYIDNISCPYGEGTHTYIEWGNDDGQVCSSERHNDKTTYCIKEK